MVRPRVWAAIGILALVVGCGDLPHDDTRGGGGSDGLDRHGQNPQDDTPASRTGSIGGRRHAPPADEMSFVRHLSETSALAISMARVAQAKATTDQMRSFAERIATDYARIGSELRALGAAGGGADRGEPAVDADDVIGRLQRLDGADFEREWLDQLVWRYSQDAAALDWAMRSGQPRLQAFAAQTQPLLQAHLARAQSLQAAVPPR